MESAIQTFWVLITLIPIIFYWVLKMYVTKFIKKDVTYSVLNEASQIKTIRMVLILIISGVSYLGFNFIFAIILCAILLYEDEVIWERIDELNKMKKLQELDVLDGMML